MLSCRKDGLEEEGYGYLSARVQEDNDMQVVIPELKSSSDDTDVFSLAVYDALDIRTAYVPDCSVLAENPLKLMSGTYTAVVSSASAQDAAFGAPFYYGTESFEIKPGEVANIDVLATIANTCVTVEYDDAVKAAFPTCDFTVTNGRGELRYSLQDGTSDEKGFFSVTGTLEWTLSLINADGVRYEDITGTIQDVKGNDHYKFSWSLSSEPEDIGAGAVSIILDDSMNEKEYTLVIDPEDSSVPVISADFDYSENFTVEVGEQVSRIVSVASADGFSSLLLKYIDPVSFAETSVELCGASSQTISDLLSDNIKASAVDPASTSATIDLTQYMPSLPIGSYTMSVQVIDRGSSFDEQDFVFQVISNLDAEAVSAAPWAMFADVVGRWFAKEQPEGLNFQYRKSADSEWTDFSGAIATDPSTRTFTARLTGLEPQTGYVFRAVSSQDFETTEIGFTTESAEVIPNMSFDAWYQDGEVWYPNQDASNFWWDTANGGTKTLSIYPTTPAEAEYIYAQGEGKNAAKLQSKSASLVGLAAGNIYTGRFIKAVISLTNPGAELDWGVPFSSRPLALTGFYHYLPKAIDNTSGSYSSMAGKPDIGQIQIMLTDWDAPFRVSTASGKFVNPQTDSGIIAYGTIDLNETSAYQPFTIELEYRDLSRTPKYIVIVAAASKYGDYFTGGVGSTLYLDEFSFIYDPDALDSAQR